MLLAPNSIRVEAGLTHNPPHNTILESVPLSDKGIPPDPKPVYVIKIPVCPTEIPDNPFVKSTDINSETYFKNLDIKQKMDDLYKNNDDDKNSKYKNYITRKNSTIVTNGSPAKPRKYILCCFFHVISKKTMVKDDT